MSNEEDVKRRLSSLRRPVSPPPARPASGSLAALEAGKESVKDPLQTVSAHLRKFTRNTTLGDTSSLGLLQIDDWKSLYTRNSHHSGRHFVIHQHDHPVAGPHYDLRLQFSESSSLSWSVMYGLPGDANSRRLNRNATETRVHSLWVSSLNPFQMVQLRGTKLITIVEPPYRNRKPKDRQHDHLGHR